MKRKPSAQARDLMADAMLANGPAYRNIAVSIRGGFVNMWIAPALAAIEQALHEDKESDDGRPA